MKVMIATRGDTLESMLAQGLGDALWYLVVDESSSVAVPFRALGQIALDEVYANTMWRRSLQAATDPIPGFSSPLIRR
jgi:hypothetical protein